MAKTLATSVRTYFEGGTFRNNTVLMEIPDEAAELILKYWQERGISNCVKAKFLASNQTGNCFMRDNENYKDLARLFEMPQEKTQEEEVFEQHFKDEEEDDE